MQCKTTVFDILNRGLSQIHFWKTWTTSQQVVSNEKKLYILSHPFIGHSRVGRYDSISLYHGSYPGSIMPSRAKLQITDDICIHVMKQFDLLC